MRSILVLFAALLSCASASASVLIPNISNPGFEQDTAGWGWQVYNAARVSYEISTSNPRSGKRCIVFKNESGQTPHVYGRLTTTVGVVPNVRYQLSCWVRGEDVSESSGFHMTDWNSYTLRFPTGTFEWRQVSVEFTTKPGQHSINIGINIADKCRALAVDDVALRPLGGQLEADGISGVILTEPRVIGKKSTVPVYMLIECSTPRAAVVEAVVAFGDRTIARKRTALERGENRIDWTWSTGKSPFGTYTCTASVLDAKGRVLAAGSVTTDLVDSPVFAEIDRIVERKKEFDRLFKECRARGINVDYPAAAREMLEQFIPLADDDVRHGLEYRAKFAITDFDRSLDEAVATMKAYLRDPALAPVTRRFRTGGIEIDDLSFIGSRTDSNGGTDRGPVLFCGHGHFGQVRRDIPRFPNYGVNIIQIEVGPSVTFPREDEVDLKAIRAVADVLDQAAKHNIMVNVLLSPHYFPAWAMRKWPHLGKGGGGFLGYCPDEEEAKQIIERFLRLAVPILKDKPALHSFCLSNEPIFTNSANCGRTKHMWNEYLARTHGDISVLNGRYGTEYASFEDVPFSGSPQAYDWLMFRMERFAGWHRWMADIIHEMAPGIPTHAKVMSNQLNAGQVDWATDHELFGNLLEINGNDCYSFPTGNPEWPMDPWMLNTSYDMQRSFARKPVFNSENHISPDGSTFYIAPEHFRTAMWQGAIHGQSATTIWVWERDYDNKWGFLGNVMDRPGCAQAVGTACLDLNRFAEEVTALQSARARVAIVYSMSSVIRRGNQHLGALLRTYQALNFSGVKIDFISEKQLAAGRGADYRLLIVPEAETLGDEAFGGIAGLPVSTRLLLTNECFTRNEYGMARDPEAVGAVRDRGIALADGDPETVLWPALRAHLDATGVSSAFSVVDAGTGEPIWGVEWLPARVGGRTVINIINWRGKQFDVKILRHGAEVDASDLLSLGGQEKVSALKTLTPVLAEVR